MRALRRIERILPAGIRKEGSAEGWEGRTARRRTSCISARASHSPRLPLWCPGRRPRRVAFRAIYTPAQYQQPVGMVVGSPRVSYFSNGTRRRWPGRGPRFGTAGTGPSRAAGTGMATGLHGPQRGGARRAPLSGPTKPVETAPQKGLRSRAGPARAFPTRGSTRQIGRFRWASRTAYGQAYQDGIRIA